MSVTEIIMKTPRYVHHRHLSPTPPLCEDKHVWSLLFTYLPTSVACHSYHHSKYLCSHVSRYMYTLHKLYCEWIHTTSVCFHSRSCVDCVSKQTISQHDAANNASHTGTCRDTILPNSCINCSSPITKFPVNKTPIFLL